MAVTLKKQPFVIISSKKQVILVQSIKKALIFVWHEFCMCTSSDNFLRTNSTCIKDIYGGDRVLKHAIIVFTKIPEVGKVKTRLTEERGGILTKEEAKDFYEASLLDVLDVCTSIDNAKVWICHNVEGDRRHLNMIITQLKQLDKIAGIFPDEGGTFDECMQYSVECLLKPGQKEKLAESILILGGDVLGLQKHTLIDAFAKLDSLSSSSAGHEAGIYLDNFHSDIGAAMVVSADQAGGFNIVGYTCNTPFDFRTVFYNSEGITALEMIAEKARETHIPILPLDIVFDIDLLEDLGGMIPMLNVLEQGANYESSITVPIRTIEVLRDLGLQSTANPIEEIV